MLAFSSVRQALRLLMVPLVISGCSETSAPEPEYTLRISLSGSDTLRARNEWRFVEATAVDNAGQPVQVPLVLSFDSPGVLQVAQLTPRVALVYAVADGKARITAAASRFRTSIEVIVRRRAFAFGLKAPGQGGITLSVGGQHLLEPVLTDSLGFDMPLPASVSFSSADSGIVHVTPVGMATGVRTGATLITARMVVPESTFVAHLNVNVRTPIAGDGGELRR
jgi:hypothetical protein